MNRSFMAVLFIASFSTRLLAADLPADKCVQLDDDCLKIEAALDILANSKLKEISWRETKIFSGLQLAGAVVFDVLGGVGVGLTCQDSSDHEAAAVVCGFSIGGIVVGCILTTGTMLTPIAATLYNSCYVYPKNREIASLLAELAQLDQTYLLDGTQLQQFHALIKDNPDLLKKVNTIYNVKQRQALQLDADVIID